MFNRKQINKKAYEILSQYSNMQAPIDIFDILDKLNINYSFDDMEDDLSGFLLVENNLASIAINDSHHPNRQRFTTAHELGHYCLHCKGKDDHRLFVDKAYRRNTISSSGTQKKEIEANRFAAAVLMPEALIKIYVCSNEITDIDIYRLSIKFQVSEQAMTLRLVRLGLIEE